MSEYKHLSKLSPGYLADFDSTTAMIIALGNFLRGEDFPEKGNEPPVNWLAKEVHKFTKATLETMYSESGFIESVSAASLNRVFSEQISEWAIKNYEKKIYPAISIGSSSGAMVHMNAILGIPWLPQTFLIPVKHPWDLEVSEPKRISEWAKAPAKVLLENNPDLQLHHMFNPVQDRLMLENMSYFKVKKLKLGIHYKKFIKEVLPRGSTIFVSDCQRKWPVTRIDDRHVFQFGGLGAANEEDFFEGSSRIRNFFKGHHTDFSKWDIPKPDHQSSEAEWGFEPSLLEDIEQFALEGGYKVKRIVFEEPDHPSPFVAELYRWAYKQRQMISNRLIVGSFVQLDPLWTFRTGSVPFWLKYNTEASADWLEQYLKDHDQYDELYLMLFAHGVEGMGRPSPDRWKSILAMAKNRGEFMGKDTEKIPEDFASFSRYNKDFKTKIQARYPVPMPMGLKTFFEFAERSAGKYKVMVTDPTP